MRKVINIILFVNLLVLIACAVNLYVMVNVDSNLQKHDKQISMAQGAITMFDTMSDDEFVAKKKNIRRLVIEVMKESEDRREFVNESSGALVQYSWALLIISMFSSLSLFFVTKPA